MPKVSVVMPVYKEQKTVVERAVNSIINQTFQDWELIIVLDWPENHELRKYLTDLSSTNYKVTFLENDKNLGQGHSRNRAIEIAKAEIIVLQDGDDFSKPERLEKQYGYLLEHPEIDVLGTAETYCNLDTNTIYYTKYFSNDIDKVIKRRNVCGHPTLMLRKSVFTNVAKYATDMIRAKGIQVYCEDYELYIKWHLAGVKIWNLPDSYYLYQRDNNIEIKAKGMIRSVISIKKKYIKQLKFGLTDHLYMALQSLLLIFPAKAIVLLHSQINNKV